MPKKRENFSIYYRREDSIDHLAVMAGRPMIVEVVDEQDVLVVRILGSTRHFHCKLRIWHY